MAPWMHVSIALVTVVVLAHVPWRQLRQGFTVVRDVKVEGNRGISDLRIVELSGVEKGQDLFEVDLGRVRQALMLEPRIARAEVSRLGLWGVRLRVTERRGVLAVPHGEPWEIDSSGVIMAPLTGGGLSDLPLLTGAALERQDEGTVVRTVEVERGLEWAVTLAAPEHGLGAGVSEIDVSDHETTTLVLMDGVRVRAGARPSGLREMAALRAVLLDLKQRGTTADEVDLRFDNQVIVRPAATAGGTGPQGRG
jgi:cell division septal protein FtsQ